jgi:MFS family permease
MSMTSLSVVEREPERFEDQRREDVAGAWPKPVYAWYVVVILLVAYGFAILDRVAIGLLVDPMKRDLHVTDSQIGLLQGLAFAICYTAFGLPLGFLTDRHKRTPILAIGIALWSAATMVCGLARGFGALFVARIGVGVGEAVITPGSGSLIADYFPPDRRPKAYGVWMLGSSLGTGMAYIFGGLAIVVADRLHAAGAPWAAHLKTWQITFFLIGAPGLLVSLLFAATVREPVRRGVRVAIARYPLKPLWRVMSANRKAYFALMGGAVLNITCVYAQIGWMPSLFMRVHHWSPAKVASTLGFVALGVGMSGALVAAWTMTWLGKRGRDDAPILMTMGHSLTILLLGVAACLAPTPQITLGLNAVAAITSTWSYAGAITGLNQITPNELRGQVTALYTLLTGLVSMTLGSFLVGFLSDTVFHGPTGVAASLASVFAGCSVLALLVLALGRKVYARAQAANAAVEAAG